MFLPSSITSLPNSLILPSIPHSYLFFISFPSIPFVSFLRDFQEGEGSGREDGESLCSFVHPLLVYLTFSFPLTFLIFTYFSFLLFSTLLVFLSRDFKRGGMGRGDGESICSFSHPLLPYLTTLSLYFVTFYPFFISVVSSNLFLSSPSCSNLKGRYVLGREGGEYIPTLSFVFSLFFFCYSEIGELVFCSSYSCLCGEKKKNQVSI